MFGSRLYRYLQRVIVIVALLGCQEEQTRVALDVSVTSEVDVSSHEAGPPGTMVDAALTLDTQMGNDTGTLVQDEQRTDMSGLEADMEHTAEPVAIFLALEDAEVIGSHSVLADGGILLDPGASLSWALDEGLVDDRQYRFWLNGMVWRYEDGSVELDAAGTVQDIHFDGSGVRNWMVGRLLYHGSLPVIPGAGRAPPEVLIPGVDLSGRLRVSASSGGLIVYGAELRSQGSSPSSEQLMELIPDSIEYRTCMDETDCDDGAQLSALIQGLPERSVRIELVSDEYRAKTPVVVRRSFVEIVGRAEQDKVVWHWDPLDGSGVRWAFQFQGNGGSHAQSYAIAAAVSSGQRRVQVNGEIPEDTHWVQLRSDDYGDVPPVCVDGRDVERFYRHQRQLFRVLSVEPIEGGSYVTLDRAIHLNIPLDAQPRFETVQLLQNVGAHRLHLLAQCPDALRRTGGTPECENPEVVDDGGILSLYVDSGHFSEVSGQGFGKFTIEIRDSLENRLEGCSMDHPSAYGSGGQGYGVHLIGASRTVVRNQTVVTARHGVVVDFGSSDSQIIDGYFARMDQALLDIHGEASRDTLIRGNRLEDGRIGIVVGGGGRAVHCNDGPRHHLLRNVISDVSIAGVSVSDHTREVFVRSNTFDSNSSHLLVTFGGRDVVFEQNLVGAATISPLTVALDDSGGVLINQNQFTEACNAEESMLVLGNAESPSFDNNLWADCGGHNQGE